MSDELKPCPFCGSEATLCRTDDEFKPMCIECEAIIEGGPIAGWFETAEDARDAWNRRSAQA